MIKNLCIAAFAALASVSANAQTEDSLEIAGFKVPLVESHYVAPTHFQDNWYVGVYGGVTSNWGSDDSHAGFFRVMGPAAAITVGKMITPVSDIRLQFSYNRNTGVTDNSFSASDFFHNLDLNPADYTHKRFKWNSYGIAFDYMANFTNLICGFRENRAFHFKGLLGLGGSVSSGYTSGKFADVLGQDNSHSAQLGNNDKYQNRRHSLVSIRAGLVADFLITRNWNLHLEAIENFLDNSFDSNPTTKNTWDGHLDVLVGVTYHFKNKGGANPGFYYPRHDMSVYQKKLQQVKDLQNKTKKKLKEIEEFVPDTVNVDAHVMYTLIAFDDESSTIDRLQQTNIYTTAVAWSRNTKMPIYITNSNVVDDKLFRKRAEGIRDLLIERYEIPASVIKIVADEKNVRPTKDYIVFIVND